MTRFAAMADVVPTQTPARRLAPATRAALPVLEVELTSRSLDKVGIGDLLLLAPHHPRPFERRDVVRRARAGQGQLLGCEKAVFAAAGQVGQQVVAPDRRAPRFDLVAWDQGAVETLTKADQLAIWDRRFLAASYAQLGKASEASRQVDTVLAIDPGFSLETFADTIQFRREEDKRLYLEGLEKAGFPK